MVNVRTNKKLCPCMSINLKRPQWKVNIASNARFCSKRLHFLLDTDYYKQLSSPTAVIL